MAGIGFRLQKILSGGTLYDYSKAYLFSALIVAGPFLSVMATLLLLRIFIWHQLSMEDAWLFLGVLVYLYAFSLLGVGPFIYVVTRYLADQHFLKHIHAYTPTYLLTLVLVFALQSILILPILFSWGFDVDLIWLLYSLYLLISGIWIAMIYLSAAQGFLWISSAFVLGSILSISFTWIWGYHHGLMGFFAAFTLGQFLTFVILTVRIFLEFGYTNTYDFGLLGYFKKYPHLILLGLFYNLGVWIDKFVFWASPSAMQVHRWIYVYPAYDTAMFLAYCTVIPSLAYFILQLETSFAKYYRAYFEVILKRSTLKQIHIIRDKMLEQLTNHFQKFLILQGLIALITIVFVENIAQAFKLSLEQIAIMRIGVLGAMFQISWMILLELFCYFDFYKDAVIFAVLFTLLSGLLSFVTVQLGLATYGYGYALATFITSVLAFIWLNYKLQRLDYYTFMLQPIILPNFKFEEEV